MSTRTVADTKAHLSEILDEVVTGREVTITRRGRAIAKLVPIVENAPPLGWAALDAWLVAGASEAPGMTVEEMRARDLL
ncbi:type II toxin-antitoxin system prevent-host-death family antitoxin [Myxococcota bacterium]|nr:type II toxin-antitoxin system prevent-host-death family antitoxin [Myxococcota bacterium]